MLFLWASITCFFALPTTQKAERERQRENEIRAFRDFSINLSSSSSPSPAAGKAGGGGGGGSGLSGCNFRDEDGEFPRGPPKRAEYKTAGVSLDALRDSTVRRRPCRSMTVQPLFAKRASVAYICTGSSIPCVAA